jgi:hypothetical protein
MSDQSHKDTRHFLDTHIHMLDHTSIQHPRWHIPTTMLLLQCLEAPQDDAFTMAETVLHIWQRVMRIMMRHGLLLRKAIPWMGVLDALHHHREGSNQSLAGEDKSRICQPLPMLSRP